MQAESLIISFSNDTSEAGSGACPSILKQEDVPLGRVTKSDIIKALEKQLFNGVDFDVNCGMSDTGYTSALNLYPSDSQIGEVGVTHGDLNQSAIYETVTETETIKFELDTEKSTKYPIDRVISIKWQGSVWDDEGNLINPSPGIEVLEGIVTTSSPVYGTGIIKYETKRYSYSLDVPARADSIGTAFNSVAWVIKDCGVELLVLNPPNGAESDAGLNIDCKGFGSASTLPQKYRRLLRPEAEPKDITNGIDYCTQIATTESYYE